ncbi:MAG: fumarylacetoacetate hydrolase family protein [Acidimicrobiia bacterium]|nr:fumarylacetoacetate hydrolase family protein [Acidimicrobiia bacterium]MDH4307926.1 fumarylacetoacetate hydrolase family protein [Acidimicrobiia bacterium]
MKWARFRHAGSVSTGRVEGDQVVPVAASSPLSAILDGTDATGDPIPLADVTLLAPIDPVRNIFCVGWNYLPHFKEGEVVHGERPLPDRPNFFTKATGTVIGPFDDIPSHVGLTEKLDWEVEMAVIIGRRCVDLSESDALSAVAAYAVAQDMTGRDVQHAHGGQWFRGKSLDGTCPIGPWLVDAGDIADPQGLDISCSVNGAVKQTSNTSTMIFTVARLLAELSRGLTLLPGDVLLSGTPEGVGMGRTPPEFLHPGDVVESTVAGIGTIRNRVV